MMKRIKKYIHLYILFFIIKHNSLLLCIVIYINMIMMIITLLLLMLLYLFEIRDMWRKNYIISFNIFSFWAKKKIKINKFQALATLATQSNNKNNNSYIVLFSLCEKINNHAQLKKKKYREREKEKEKESTRKFKQIITILNDE